ncbi:hypothetical protein ACH5RR_034400 [Cinchona calisaya]|uniref:ARM repeat superfamily protein n=1 Tax=Cinchona calisaya TaxID=153742 RepID=A0ABD2YED9_9GENT
MCNDTKLLVVDALCNVVAASPAKAATAVVLQAERELQPWRINQRNVKVIVELMRNNDTPESLVILSQLELLEATARAVQPVLEWGESGLAVADGLSNLLKPVNKCSEAGLSGLYVECLLPATVRCLSHPSAHVRVLSKSVLQAILYACSLKSSWRNGEE